MPALNLPDQSRRAVNVSEPAFVALVRLGFAPSYGEGRRLVRAGRLLVNGKPVPATEEDMPVTEADRLEVRSTPSRGEPAPC